MEDEEPVRAFGARALNSRGYRVLEASTGQEALDLILEAAIYAPSGHNEQPWHFTVIQNRRIAGSHQPGDPRADGPLRDRLGAPPGVAQALPRHLRCPTLVVVSGRRDAITWQTDCAAAIQNMLLAAESWRSARSGWAAALLLTQAQEMVPPGDPPGYEPYYGVALGYKGMQPAPRLANRVWSVTCASAAKLG
ncbi:MAG: nitroreductase family protein [Phycisphaerales bacterium]|nr:nitroreductase family protein [Phycisphaerales bacterium]